MSEILDLASGRYLNKTAIREHALKCSAAYRANRFTCVGEDFMDEVKADVEALVRDLNAKYQTLHPTLEAPQNGTGFVTGELADRVKTALNEAIGRLIQNKVQKQPSCGKTLGRTR